MKKNKSKKVNDQAEPKTRSNLKDSVKSSIDKILESEAPTNHKDLAELYLENKEDFPWPLKSDVSKHMEKLIDNIASSGAIKPEVLKPMVDDFWESWREIFEEKKGRISKPTMNDLEKNYNKQTIERILEALVDFELLLEKPPTSALKELDKCRENTRKQHESVINATGILLKKAHTTDSEREVIQKIKTKHEIMLGVHSKGKKVTLDPLKERLLNLLTTPTSLATSEGWMREYFRQYIMINFTRPLGRPRSLFDKTLMVVIYKLLERGNSRFRRKNEFAARLVQCCKGIEEEVTPKDIENALHT